MRLNKKSALPVMESFVKMELAYSRRSGLSCSGLFYSESLRAGGVDVTFFVPPGIGRNQIEHAITTVRDRRDVVYHEVLVCPVAWFSVSKVAS